MAQEKRRTISYRSFVTCDNPKGVECGAIRKSKQHSNKVESEKKRQENQTSSLAITKEDKKQMGITGFTRDLVDVSPSDHLDPVTNSWSNNGHKEDIAKDLLKGVFDLQESLVILSRLQETSCCKSKRKQKQKQKQKLKEMRFNDMENRLMDSNPFGSLHDEKKLHMGFLGPRASVDGSSRKSVDEVRSVVRESLLRQNVMKNPTYDHFHHTKLDCPALPSTSSNNFSLFDSSISSTASQRRKKGKSSNLIVKLMGLESFPSSPRDYKGIEKFPNLTKPMYDIQSPQARKPKFAAQELGTKERAFDEILESLYFKGILRSNSAKGMSPNSRNFEDCFLVDEGPPIVVMRPLRFWGDGDLRNGGNIEKPSSRRGCTQQTVRSSEAANFRDKFREVAARSESCKEKRLSPKKAAYDEEKVYVDLHRKPQKKQADVRRISEDAKVTSIRRKGDDKKNTEHFDELGSWDLGNLTKTKMQKQKYGDFFSKNQNSYRDNIFSTSLLDYRNVKTSESPNRWRKKWQPVSSMQVEIPRCKGERKKNEATAREEVDSSSENECVFPTFDSMLINNRDIDRWNKCSGAMISGYDAESQTSISETLEGIEYLNNDKDCCDNLRKGHLDDNQSFMSEITSTSVSEHCSIVGDHLDENQSLLSEHTSVAAHEIGITAHELGTNEEGNTDNLKSCQPYEDFIEGATKCLTPRAKMKAFLLSSSLFVNQAEDLFNLQVNPGSIPHVTDESDLEVANPKLLLDCAIELMEFRSSQFTQVIYPRNSTSVGQLLEEICKGIEDLGCYLNPDSEGFSSDNLHALLDRDLRLKSGMWESGWRNMFSLDDVEQIVGEVDEYVLDKLIEEVLADFLP